MTGIAFGGLAALFALAGSAALTEDEVDRLCPPRPETASAFREGAYPPASRSYRAAALKVFAYMTSLRAMRNLVEAGEPDQAYQHNAYVSKTHAAHIHAMLAYARLDPARRADAMRFASASAEYLLSQLEPVEAPLAWWPPTYGREPLRCDSGTPSRPAMVGNDPEGAVKYRGEVMLLYPADVGTAFVEYYRETKDRRFLDAAVGIGETYLKTRRVDGSWPLKMKLATGETVCENPLVPTRPLAFFKALGEVTGDVRWRDAADGCFAWLQAHPLQDWNWDGQFEDVEPCEPYADPTEHNAIETMLELLSRSPSDEDAKALSRRILRFCEDRFVCWEKPENHPEWDVPSVLEQYSCFVPIDASAAKMIRGYLALWRVTGEAELLAKARALGDTLTRVQQADGRIPTFWTHDLMGEQTYDWLNCMAAGALALAELAEPARPESFDDRAEDSFEEYEIGQVTRELAGWSGAGTVVPDRVTSAGLSGVPLEDAAHEKVLEIEGDACRSYGASEKPRTVLDMLVRISRRNADQGLPSEDEMRQSGPLTVLVDSEGWLCAWQPDERGAGRWTPLAFGTRRTFADDEWVRLTVILKREQDGAGEITGVVCVNGVKGTPWNRQSDSALGGTCLRTFARSSMQEIAELQFEGDVQVDDVVLTDALPGLHLSSGWGTLMLVK